MGARGARHRKPGCDELVGRGGSWDDTNPGNLTATTRAGAPPSTSAICSVCCVKSLEGK